MVRAAVVEKAMAELEKDHGLAMIVATQEERARCLRVLSSWSRFALAHNASAETHAILFKVAIEIGTGREPVNITNGSTS